MERSDTVPAMRVGEVVAVPKEVERPDVDRVPVVLGDREGVPGGRVLLRLGRRPGR